MKDGGIIRAICDAARGISTLKVVTQDNNETESFLFATLNPLIIKLRPFVLLHYMLLCLILLFLILIYKQKLKYEF